MSVTYPLYRFPVDTNGNPVGAEAYGMLRDSYNELQGTLLVVYRRESSGGNDGAGVREYTVCRGVYVESVEATLDPSSELPIAIDLSGQPRKVRSYLIHQPSSGTTLDLVSSSSNDTMDVTIEDEGASTTETKTLNGTTTVTTTASFSDIDAIELSDNPEGTITVSDGGGTTLCTIEGGNTYSDDNNSIDGDRGVPALGSGSHASSIGGNGEHFLGDTFTHGASSVFDRINSASWSIENDLTTSSLHDTRAMAIDVGNRTVSVDVDAQGQFISHNAMMEALQRVQGKITHKLDGGDIEFNNCTMTDSDSRTISADDAVTGVSVTYEAGDSPLTLTKT